MFPYREPFDEEKDEKEKAVCAARNIRMTEKQYAAHREIRIIHSRIIPIRRFYRERIIARHVTKS